jgi:pimeloyl-ACP methyl ester carboxylesterase
MIPPPPVLDPRVPRIFDTELSDRLEEVIGKLDLAVDTKALAAAPPDPSRRRRGFDPRDQTSKLALAPDEYGVLRWVYQPAIRGSSSRRARRAAERQVADNAVHEIDIKDTPPNEVLDKIKKLDDALTPNQGLRRVIDGQLEITTCDGIDDDGGPTLLLVHGTFSKSDMFTTELGAIDQGKELLARAHGRYKRVLAFDHPTLSVSPWINAIDLERALVNVRGDIDVVCHSRGGLVVAWWLRKTSQKVRNVIFVGSPLQGTSLASPAHLRSALDYFANIATAAKLAAGAAAVFLPFMTAVQGLAAILSGILHAAASTPLADAAVAVVPGLAGQSRVGNNFEIERLTREKWASTATYHAVMSNFQPSAGDSMWQFWKYFQNPKEKILGWGADAIFEVSNDLVVDTQSMARTYHSGKAGGDGLPDAITDVHDFGVSRTVHHTNYFRQPETVAFLQQTLGL